MRRVSRVLLLAAVAFGVLVVPASAQITVDQSRKMSELFKSPNQATNSDLAFWGDHAFVGYYTGDTGFPAGSGPRGGVRIYDISNPSSPRLVKNFACDANQNDPIVWDRNGNGVADLMLLAVDRTMVSPECGAARTPSTYAGHATPTGWEGVRIFTMSDDPRNPFQTITPVKMQYTDCGAHTITAWTGFAEERTNPRLIVYVSSYPLRPGPTCGQSTFNNVSNPYDEDKVANNPLHGQIQVLSVPLNNPAATTEIARPEISYEGDPDGRLDWCERGGNTCPPNFEPFAVACHDIVVHMEHNLAGGACGEQGQVWEIDPDTGIPDTEDPISVGDDEVTGGDDAQFPGAVDFFHSVMFNNDGTVVNWVDESFDFADDQNTRPPGTGGCPNMTPYQPRTWNPQGGVHKTGRMFFTDLEGEFLSEFHVGDRRPDGKPGEYCSAHMGMAVMGIERDLLVNAWYTGGVNVIDFSNPRRLREIAYYDPARVSGTWSAYPYAGPLFKGKSRKGRSGRVPIYATDGVEDHATAQGMVVYRTNKLPRPGRKGLVDHLNPQTMDHEMDSGKGKGRGKDKGRGKGRGHDRGKGRGRDRDDDRGKGRGKGRGRDRDDDRGKGRGDDRGKDRDDDDDDDRGKDRGDDDRGGDDDGDRGRSRDDDDDDDDDRGRSRDDDDDDDDRGRGRSRDDDD